MSRRHRLVWTWVLMLVLPLQGLAASCLGPCAAGLGALPMALTVGAEALHGAEPCHAPAAVEASATTAEAGEGAPGCSACAACGAAFALPSTVPALMGADIVRAAAVSEPVVPGSALVEGLERPPRRAPR